MGATMYEAASHAVWEAYGAHLSGSRQGTFGVVSARPLRPEAARALESSARQLGFGESACVFCTLHAAPSDGGATAAAGSAMPAGDGSDGQLGAAAAGGGSGGQLDSQLDAATLFEVVEGIDPIVLVAADSEAARALSQAYRTEIAPLARSRALGRTTVAFRSFEDMLGSPQDKQVAWALLKKLV